MTATNARVSVPPRRSLFAGVFVCLLAIGAGCSDATEPPVLRPLGDGVGASLFAADVGKVTAEETELEFELAVTAEEPVPTDPTLVIPTTTRYGTLVQKGTNFQYIPAPEFNGVDTFEYYGVVGTARSNTATVTIQVTPVNDAPQAMDLEYVTPEDELVTGMLHGSDVEGDLLTFEVVTSPLGGTLTYDSATGAFTFTVTPGFTGITAFEYVVSDGKLESEEGRVEITVIDATPPTLNSVTLWDGNSFVRSAANVTLAVNADSTAEEMEVWGDILDATGWIPFTAQRTVDLTPGDGIKTVYVRVRDAYENVSVTRTDTIILDTQGPSGAVVPAVVYTNQTGIDVELQAEDVHPVTGGVLDGPFNGAPLATGGEPYPKVQAITLSGADGIKVLTATYFDQIGNVGGPYYGAVTLDRVAPAGAVTAATTVTTTRALGLTLWYNDSSPVTAMRLDGDLVGEGDWVTPASDRTVLLTDGDGPKAITFEVVDAAGNIGGPFFEDVTLDTQPPGIVFLSGPRALTTDTAAPTFDFEATDAASSIGQLYCSEDDGATWFACSSPHSWTSDPVTSGSSGVFALTVTATDAAGNTSTDDRWAWEVTGTDRCGETVLFTTNFSDANSTWTRDAPWDVTSDPLGVAGDVLADSPAAMSDYTASTDVAAVTGATVASPCWMTGRSQVVLSFRHFYEVADNGDVLRLETRTNGGSWTPRLTINGPAAQNTWQWVSLAIPGVAEGDALEWRFRLTSDGDANVADGWFVDEVTVAVAAVKPLFTSYQIPGQILSSPVVQEVNQVGPGREAIFGGTVNTTYGRLYVYGVTEHTLLEYVEADGPVQGPATLRDTDGDAKFELFFGTDQTVYGVVPEITPLPVVTFEFPGLLDPAVAVGNLGAGAQEELVVAGTLTSDFVRVLRFDDDAESFSQVWARDLRPCIGGLVSCPGGMPNPALHDTNSDGYRDILISGWAGDSAPRVFSLSGTDGSTLWAYDPVGGVGAPVAVGDLNGDGITEAVFATNANAGVHVVTAATGERQWRTDLGGSINVSPALGDLNGDGNLEIVVVDSGGTLYVLDHVGAVLRRVGLNSTVASPPSLADLNGDGAVDIVLGADNGRLYALSGTGPVVHWLFAAAAAIQSGPNAIDATGDGNIEVTFGANDGRLYVISAEAPEPASAQRPWPMFRHDGLFTGVGTGSAAAPW